MAQPCVGLSQAELDAMCQEEDIDSPPSPVDEDLYGAKRRRRITMSAMGSEITSISDTTAETESELAKRREVLSLTTDPQQGGLAQAALDELQVSEESNASVRESSPVGSALRILKRRRDSTGAGVEAMTARANELFAMQVAPVEDDGGLTQKELDELGSCQQRSESPESGCASEALSVRRRRAFRAAAPSPVKTPHSPRRRRSRAVKLDVENVNIMIDAENNKIDANADGASVPSFPSFSKSPAAKEVESPSRRAPRMRQCPLSPVNGCI